MCEERRFGVQVQSGTKLVIIATVVLGLLTIWLSLDYFYSLLHVAIAKDVFEAVVANVLLPMFKILVSAVLGWVFGAPVVNSIAKRIANR